MEIIRSKKKRRTKKEATEGSEVFASIIDNSSASILDTIILRSNEIYTNLGLGHTESVYHRAMEAELREAGIRYESEVITPIMYKSYYVGYGRADIVINRNGSEDQRIVVELKALATNVFKQNELSRLKTYMHSLGIKKGIMVNFPQTQSNGKCIFRLVQ